MMSVFLFALLLFLSNSFRIKMINEMKVSNENYITISFGDKSNSLNYKYLPLYTEENVKSIVAVEGLQNVNGVKIITAENIESERKKIFNNIIFGCTDKYFENLEIELGSGSFPSEKNEILVGGSIAEYADLQIEDELLITVSNEKLKFRVCGIIKKQENQAFSSIPSEINQMMAIHIHHDLFKNSNYYFMNGIIDDTKLIDEVSEKVINILSKDEVIINSLDKSNISPMVTSRKDVIDMIDNWYNYINYFIICIISVITIVSVANIINIFHIKINERLKDIMTFFIVGASSGQVKKIFMYESLIIGLKATILGELIAIVTYFITAKAIGFPLRFNLINLTLPILAGILTAFISGLFVGKVIDNIDLETLSNE